MQVTYGAVVSLSYKLEIKDENSTIQMVDESQPGQPLVFLCGYGNVIPGYEKQLLGKEEGDTYDFWVMPEEGYGVSDPNQIAKISIDTFKDDEGKIMEDLLQLGAVVPMKNDEGHRIDGIIKGISDTDVIMDFNNPLADKELHFTGVIEKVREALPEEVDHGHVHGEGGHHH
jgi:FKBP-type peptidyl-prolyl cis-trans isomerase SlyD